MGEGEGGWVWVWGYIWTYSNEVPPARPATQRMPYIFQRDPRPPSPLDDSRFEEGSQEERCREQEAFDGLCDSYGPVAHVVQGVPGAGEEGIIIIIMAIFISTCSCAGEDQKGDEAADEAGDGDGADAGFDDGRGVADEGGGGSSGGGEVEGDDVEESVGHL